MTRLLLVLLPLLVFSACHPPADHPAANTPAADTADKRNYFPVQDLLKEQIAMVDSTPYRVMLYHIKDGKKDSVLLKAGQFDAEAKAFLVPGMDSADIAQRFTESSFMDQSTGLLTFTYATKDTLSGVRRVDVLLEPGLNNDKIHLIYLEVSEKDNDSLKLRKMTWTAGRNFSIVELVHPPQGAAITRDVKTITRETKVVWDDH